MWAQRIVSESQKENELLLNILSTSHSGLSKVATC